MYFSFFCLVVFFFFFCFFFFFNDTATTEIYTLSLHDALPIFSHAWNCSTSRSRYRIIAFGERGIRSKVDCEDRKSTRLNSSHVKISYAVFCLKKKKAQKEEVGIRVVGVETPEL